MKLFPFVALLALSVDASGATANDYQDIVSRAFASIDADYHSEWAFTETSLNDGVEFVGRFDPRWPAGEKWQLLTVDGRDPTPAEVEEYVDGKPDHEQRDPQEEDDAAIVRLETLELIEETDDFWRFAFVPQDDGEDPDDAEFMAQLDGELRVIKDGHYVSNIDLRNEKPIKPATGVKITTFRTQLLFGPAAAGGPVVPLSVDVAVQGRAMLVVSFDEKQSLRYSDYAFVGSDALPGLLGND